MKIMKMVGLLVMSALVSVSAFGQVYPVAGYYGEKSYANPENYAVVPLQVVMEGGKGGVTSELLTQVNEVDATLTGRSVVGQWNGVYLGREELRSRGYENDGVFGQLALALGGLPFSANVVRVPQGYYEVHVEMNFRNQAGKVCLLGSVWPSIWEQEDGTLVASYTMPYISIPDAVAIKFEGRVRAARWLSPDYQDVELPTSWNEFNNSSLVTLFQSMFESGTLVVAFDEPAADGGYYRVVTRGYDLANGGVVEGKDLLVRLSGRASSSAVVSVSSFTELKEMGYRFYTSNGELYGNYPAVVEITLTERFDGVIPISVPVWGSDTRVSPAVIMWEIKASPNTEEIGSHDRVLSGQSTHLGARRTYHLKLSFPGLRGDGGKG